MYMGFVLFCVFYFKILIIGAGSPSITWVVAPVPAAAGIL